MAYNVGTIVATMKANAQGFTSAIDKMIQDVDRFQSRMKATALIGVAMASGAGLFIDAGIKQNATIERLSVSYRVLLKDAKAANDAMTYVRKLADTSPYQMEETLDAGRAMLAYGLDLKTYMVDAMNLASAMGVSLNEVVRALGRIKSGDFGEAFERLRDFGLSRDLLEGKGLVFDRSGAYQGSVDEALAAIQEIIRERFGGMVQEQAETWNGIISTITDKLKSLTADATEDTFAMLKGPLKALRDWLEGIDPVTARVVGGIVQLIGVLGVLVATSSAFQLWGATAVKALSGVGLAAKTLFTNPVFLAIAAAAALAIAISTINSASATARKRMLEEADAARKSASENEALATRLREVNTQIKQAEPGSKKYQDLQREQQSLIQRLCEVYPELNKYKTTENTLRQEGIDKLTEEIKKERELATVKEENARKSIERDIARTTARIESDQKIAANLEKRIAELDVQLGMEGLSREDADILRGSQNDYAASLREIQDRITYHRGVIRGLQAERAKLDAVLEPGGSGSGNKGRSAAGDAAAAQRLSAMTTIRDNVLEAIGKVERREIDSINDRYAEYEKMGLKTIEIDGEVYSLQEAQATELAALRRKYDEERRQLNEQGRVEIEQQGKAELAFMKDLQRDLLRLQQDGQAKELQLLDLEKADEETRARETIQNEELLQQALQAIDAKYAAQRQAIIDRSAREAAETEEKLSLAGLEYQHQYALISDEEYYRQRIALAQDHTERMAEQYGRNSLQYQEAMAEVTRLEYDSIVAREGLQRQLTRTELLEIQKRLRAQLIAGNLTQQQVDAILAALKLVEDELGNDAENAKQKFENLKSSLQTGIADIVKDLAHGSKSITEIWDDMLGRMLDSFIDFLAKLAAEKLATWVLNLIPGLSMEGGGLVPGLSVASAAGGMLTGSFSGGVPAILHEEEMVLPKSISQFILETMEMVRGEGGSGTNVNIYAMDSQDVIRVLTKNKDLITGFVADDYRRNGKARRG